MSFYADGLAYLFDQLRTHLGQGSTLADIQVRTTVRGGYTDTPPSWTTVKTAVPCLIQSMPDKDVAEGVQKRSGERAYFRVQFGPGLGLDLTRDYRIVINGRHFLVSGYHLPTSAAMPTSVECYEFRS